MTKTFKEIREFNMAANRFYSMNPKAIQTKLGYAIKKVIEGSVTDITKEYNKVQSKVYYDNVQVIQIDNALTDKETGAIIMAEKGSEREFTYNKEGLKACMKAEKDYVENLLPPLIAEWDVKEFDIDPYYAFEIPSDLPQDMQESFEGFVIGPDTKISESKVESK